MCNIRCEPPVKAPRRPIITVKYYVIPESSDKHYGQVQDTPRPVSTIGKFWRILAKT